MKKLPLLLLYMVLISSLCAQNITNNMDSLSYSLGVLVAKNLQQQGIDKIDAASMAAAVDDLLSGKALKISPDQAGVIFQQHMKKQLEEKNKEKIAVGKTFLEENAKRAEITTMPSGLQYEVLTPGTGLKPTSSDKVKVHYEGTLIDGTVFDSSYKRGAPATFGVTQVIQGWVEGLQLMQEGAKWKLYIPYDLAYGERGSPPKIGPFSALIFTVELLSIE